MAQDSGDACAMTGGSCAIIYAGQPGNSESGHYGDGNGKPGQARPTGPGFTHNFVTPQTYTESTNPFAIGMQSTGGNGGNGGDASTDFLQDHLSGGTGGTGGNGGRSPSPSARA
jgi:hypothetical protein